MSDPTDYHRKLADRLCGIYAANPKRDNRPIFAAVLTSEQVVDPEGHRQLQEGWAALAALKDTAEAEVERMTKDAVDVGGFNKDLQERARHLQREVERLERIDRVTAEALASARAEVERLKRIEDKYWEQTKVATDAESEVERLKALLDKGHASSDKRDDEICKEAHAEGMERAAVIAEDYPGDNMMIAAAIRAEVKQ